MISISPENFYTALGQIQRLATANQRAGWLYILPDGYVWATLSEQHVPDTALAKMKVDYDLKATAGADAAPDRPHFDLSPEDILAADTIAFWIDKAALNGVSPPKLEMARQTHKAYLDWPNRKLPD